MKPFILVIVFFFFFTACTTQPSWQSSQPQGYTYDYSVLTEKTPVPTPFPRVISKGEEFLSSIDVDLMYQLKQGCHDDLDCVIGESSCYNLNLFDNGRVDVPQDPGCFELRAGEWACYSQGEIKDCRCDNLVCKSYTCVGRNCEWQ